MGSVYRPKGRRRWQIKYYRDGRPIIESTGTTNKAEARALLKEREAAGRSTQQIAAGAPTTNLYVPPTGGEPLDAIEQAFVRMMVDLVVKRIRAEETARPRAVGANADDTTKAALATNSPWMKPKDAEAYTHRHRRTLANEVKRGRLRAARIGSRGQFVYRREWLDEWIESQAPVAVVARAQKGSR